MPKKIDITTVSPERAALLLARREQKRREYARRKDEIKARNRAWQLANLDKRAAMSKAWAEANPERKATTTRAWYERNHQARLDAASQRWTVLTDGVVRSYFAHHSRTKGLTSKDVPDELLPLVRASILVKRLLKGKNQ